MEIVHFWFVRGQRSELLHSRAGLICWSSVPNEPCIKTCTMHNR